VSSFFATRTWITDWITTGVLLALLDFLIKLHDFWWTHSAFMYKQRRWVDYQISLMRFRCFSRCSTPEQSGVFRPFVASMGTWDI
jgi:hypothetical protein